VQVTPVDGFDDFFRSLLASLSTRKVVYTMREFKDTKKGADVLDIQAKKGVGAGAGDDDSDGAGHGGARRKKKKKLKKQKKKKKKNSNKAAGANDSGSDDDDDDDDAPGLVGAVVDLNLVQYVTDDHEAVAALASASSSAGTTAGNTEGGGGGGALRSGPGTKVPRPYQPKGKKAVAADGGANDKGKKQMAESSTQKVTKQTMDVRPGLTCGWLTRILPRALPCSLARSLTHSLTGLALPCHSLMHTHLPCSPRPST
jgi:hypothetical protein